MGRKVPVALAILVGLAGTSLVATPAAASTQTVGVRVGSWRCPQHGVYGISKVVVTGTNVATLNMSADRTFSNTTQTASVPITGVPAGGGAGNFTATYHCKIKVGFWYIASQGEPAVGQRWVYGTPPQPTYTL